MNNIIEVIKEWFCQIGLLKSIELLAGIGAFIASLIALFTLREIRRQRKDTIRPNVFLNHGGIAYCFPESEEHILRTSWSKDENNEENKEENEIIVYSLVNAGFGIAEDLIIEEKFDIDKAIKFIKNHDKENEISILKTDYGYEITTSFDETFQVLYRQKSLNKREIGYMLTHSQNKDGSSYEYDRNYLVFISCFDYLKNKYDQFLSFDDFPANYITLRYKDSVGTSYKREFISKFMTLSEHSYIVKIEDKKNSEI